MSDTLQIKITSKNDIQIMTSCGRIDDETSGDFQTANTNVLDQGSINLIIDLSGINYISSVGFRVLLNAQKRAKPSGDCHAFWNDSYD